MKGIHQPNTHEAQVQGKVPCIILVVSESLGCMASKGNHSQMQGALDISVSGSFQVRQSSTFGVSRTSGCGPLCWEHARGCKHTLTSSHDLHHPGNVIIMTPKLTLFICRLEECMIVYFYYKY